MITDREVTLTVAIMDFFGKPEGGNTAFLQEMKALTDADKAEFRKLLIEKGYRIR